MYNNDCHFACRSLQRVMKPIKRGARRRNPVETKIFFRLLRRRRNIVVKVLQQRETFLEPLRSWCWLDFCFRDIFCCFRFLYLNSERFADLKAKSSEDRRSEQKNLFLLSGRHFSCCVILMNAERLSGHGAYITMCRVIGWRDCRTRPARRQIFVFFACSY